MRRIWRSIVFCFFFYIWCPVWFLILPPIRGQESSAMQRSAKGWPRTHHQHKRRPLPPLLPHHPFDPCKSSRSTRSRSSGQTPSVKQTGHRSPETAVPSVNRCSLSEEPTLRQNLEARGWRFRSTRDASIPSSRGPDAVAKSRTFPPAHQNDPMDRGACRTPFISNEAVCIYDLQTYREISFFEQERRKSFKADFGRWLSENNFL